ncbi:hypothetical protein [Algoriphagus sp.]|uniref:hypothetical protein n=1 Tax=Algoriphagus sp. TaxID=1872435 RepID=UPI002732255C|nr:hypothetical protein [Algoriphagus sp.]MDP2042311.1 hypothetical protein [Algoriphagus sp.]
MIQGLKSSVFYFYDYPQFYQFAKIEIAKIGYRRQTTVHSRWQSGSKSTARLIGLLALFPMATGKKADIQIT